MERNEVSFVDPQELSRADNDGMFDMRNIVDAILINNQPLVILDGYDCVAQETAVGEGMPEGK